MSITRGGSPFYLTYCPTSLGSFYIATCHTKRIKISGTYSEHMIIINVFRDEGKCPTQNWKKSKIKVLNKGKIGRKVGQNVNVIFLVQRFNKIAKAKKLFKTILFQKNSRNIDL